MRTAIRWLIPYFAVVVLASGGLAQEPEPAAGVELIYAVGADLSFLKAAEDRGVEFKDDGVVRPGLDIFRDHGYDWIRLRIFHTPTELPNDLEYTIELAQEARALGYRFLLDYHYADGWADPQKQPIPAAWDTTDIGVLADSVREWTAHTIRAFREAGVMPQMVQIGNEVRNGMLWPLGRLPENWDNFARLFEAGLEGIRDGRGTAPMPQIMLHYDNGADTEGAGALTGVGEEVLVLGQLAHEDGEQTGALVVGQDHAVALVLVHRLDHRAQEGPSPPVGGGAAGPEIRGAYPRRCSAATFQGLGGH